MAGSRVTIQSGCSHETFFRMVERERERSGRNGSSFCIIIFRVPPTGMAARELLSALQPRLRCYDVLGNVMDNCFSILLPDTDRKGAQCFMSAAVKHREWKRLGIRYRVLSYPDDWKHKESIPGEGRSDTIPKRLSRRPGNSIAQ